MNLRDCGLRPGEVLEVLDTYGTIKAEVHGIFSREDQDKLPPIQMWPMGGTNTFSSINVGDEIWVLYNETNPEQLYWFRKDDHVNNNGKFNKFTTSSGESKSLQEHAGIEVLFSKEVGSGWASMYYSDEDGCTIKNQDAKLQVDPNGDIIASNGQPHGTIKIDDDGINLGGAEKSEDRHPVPHGDKVEELFGKMLKAFRSIQVAAETSIYTKAIAEAIKLELGKFEDDMQYINSDHVTVD